jgi:isoleucyl-tRNA synthetase
VKKCRDTLDVWIDSGCSHAAVLDAHPELHAPCDLYLEATDQHRGWFQSSLMLSVGYRGTAPYKTVMTHGFVVDKDKKKLSKSEAEKAGKPIDAAHFYNKYGADIVRLWVSSVDWQNEVPFGEDLFKQVAEPYRRLRNTLRILLGNLDGFDPSQSSISNLQSPIPLLDRWILERLHAVTAECRKAYETYEFRKVFNALNNFCTHDLSATYIDATKDRMYCDAAGLAAPPRLAMRDARDLHQPRQTARADPRLHRRRGMGTRPFTTGSVHEQDFPEPDPAFAPGEATKPRSACSKSNTPSRPPSKAASRPRNSPATTRRTFPDVPGKRRRAAAAAQRPRIRHRVLHHRRAQRHDRHRAAATAMRKHDR